MSLKLVKVTPEMHDKWLHEKIITKGLRGSVKEQLDGLIDICHSLDYMGFSEVTERAQIIIDLIEKYAEISKK